MNWQRKRTIISFLFIAGIALLAVMGSVSVYLDRSAVHTSEQLSAIRKQYRAASDLLVALIDIETGVRGYLIAGDPTYLEPFYRGRNAVLAIQADMGPAINNLSRSIYGDLPLGSLIQQRSKLMDDTVDMARSRGLDAARNALAASNAKPLMDRMRGILGSETDDLLNRASTLRTNADYLADLISVLVVTTISLAILFSIIKFMLFRNEVNTRGTIEMALRRRNDERRQIAELSTALQLSDSRREAYGIIDKYTQSILKGIPGAFYVYTASRDQLSLVAQWGQLGESQHFIDHLKPADCWGLRQGGQHIAATGQPSDLDTGTGMAPVICNHVEESAGAYTCIPIVGRGQILAMLHLRGPEFRAGYKNEALNGLIERLADQLSLSLTNIELREKLENMALRDGLTGLYNRRFLDEMLEHDLAKLKRAGKRGALLLLDVDHFKRFNDTYGHQAGDEALRRVGTTLAASVRASDAACRYGGEEFLIFLPECELEEAASKAESIRQAVSAIPIRVGNETIPPITISIGVAIFPDTAANRTELIHIADRALYRAKGAGRDRVVVAEGSQPSLQAAK